MGILQQLNSTPVYCICGAIVAFVAVVCVVFMVRPGGQAWPSGWTKRK